MFFGMQLRSLIGRRDWREDVSAYMDGELSTRDRTRIEARLAESAEMREYLADLEEMRSVLRAFEPTPGTVPFQLTTEMLNDPSRLPLQSSVANRAIRLSMSTAAVGVATFAAVMVFDAVDSPTVTFTTTAAGDTQGGVPTAAVVTDQVEIETQSQPVADSSASPHPSRSEAAAQEQEAEESATVASVEIDEEQAEAEEESGWQAQQEAEEADAEEAAEEQAQQSAVSKDSAADDPSRRAITAGRGGSDTDTSEAQTVTAADVVQQQESATEDAELDQAESAEPEVAEESDSSEATSTDESSGASDDGAATTTTQTETVTRTVATSVQHSESDWPLEQRPRSGTVQLARDPSWEGPVQIVLAVIAIGATLLWLGLTIVDRRRRT